MQFKSISEIGTSAHESGGGFQHDGHSTQGSRKARLWLDADGGNFSGSDYYYIEKTGGSGVNHILQNAASMSFSTQGSTRMTIDENGIVTKPAQPAFMARQAEDVGAISNVAANATAVTIPFSSEVFDQNSDYNNSNYTFTAPVSGRYQFNFNLLMTSVTSDATYVRGRLVTSNRNYDLDIIDPVGASRWTFRGSVLADMDANDTAIVDIAQYEGTAQMDSNTATSTFSGYLVA